MPMVPKHFNTTGPVRSDKHFCIDPLSRVDWEDIQFLISSEKYFLLHAPRQTGKTTMLLAMMETLNASGDYLAVYANIQSARSARDDVDQAMTVVCRNIGDQAAAYGVDETLPSLVDDILATVEPRVALGRLLQEWAQRSPLPIVLMLDEADTLVGDSLLSLLDQIRSGFPQRPKRFPQSIVLCGVRDIQDYRIDYDGKKPIAGGSPFNIKAESLLLGNFRQEEVAALYGQFTQETAQRFADGVLEEIWFATEGQPWLVNALGHEMTWKDKQIRGDRSQTISLKSFFDAKERLIRSRQTHLHQLSDKLREERVRNIVEKILAGADVVTGASQQDIEYVVDLGLVNRKPVLRIANDIYQEVIPRELTSTKEATINFHAPRYVKSDGQLDVSHILRDFQQFFRENSEAYFVTMKYKEAAAQLLMQAFMQKIVNGEGRINREYGLGKTYTDLYIEWPTTDEGFYGNVQRVTIELKVLRNSLEKTIDDGIKQLGGYLDKSGSDGAHLVIFNQKESSWDKKIWHQTKEHGGRTINIWGC